MVVLKSIAWILAGLLALLMGISLLPVDLLLQSDGVRGFRIRVRILGITFGGSKKPKKERPESALVKAIKKSLGLSHLDADAMRSTVRSHGFSMTLKDTVETFFLLLNRVLWLLKHCKVPYCRITAISAGEDGALDYGIACATLYPLAGYLQERMGLPPKRLKLDLRCDYALEEGQFELDLAIRVRVFHGLHALWHILKKNVEKNLKEVS